MTFEEWWNRQMVDEWWEKQTMWPSESNTAKAAWQAAQEAERERILKIVEQVGIQGNHNEWFDCCDTIVEKITGVRNDA